MKKSIHTAEQVRLRSLLKDYRKSRGLRQAELASLLGKPQSFVSKYESGERRLDLVELGEVCSALDVTLVEFVVRFQDS